ncbi:hypothetical protein L207DRAFT_579033 [Hyaloscypha variabilis F]|uniref:Cupredoxin n=1 Tax=Hyaloscypha variabilis (strain UAMH 11265 / GT02V1 / F) TaxID=1149755 RepID=A0A2J6RZY2_HYAVF|nr:hypothetical protein L207DRAFT_579033 [Hyaloscypha variabilis F]
MRFSAAAALCAAPLALAGTLQSDLAARGAVGIEEGLSVESSSEESHGGKDVSKSSSNGDNGNSGNVVLESSSITEIIIIWVNNGGGSPTTTIQPQSTFALQSNAGSNQGSTGQTSVAGVAASQATHTVVVGGSAGLVYSPDTIEAAIGDMVIFTFLEQNHTATQSAFTTPCEKLDGGIDSGFMPNINSSVTPPPQMAMQVTVATPIWFYCRQKGHCGKGMTFSINPTVNKTQAMFQQMAIAQNGTGTTAVIAGGSATGVSSSVVVAGSAATASANSGSTGSGTLVTGSGSLDSTGACDCSCLCGAASFPNAAIQGVNAFGGISGAMPVSALISS